MAAILNPKLEISLDRDTPTSALVDVRYRPDRFVADVTVSCDVELSDWTSGNVGGWASLRVDLLGVDGTDREELARIAWVEINGEGEPIVRSSQFYLLDSTDTVPFVRSCRINQGELDEDPAEFVRWGPRLMKFRRDDQIEARFTLTRWLVSPGGRWVSDRVESAETTVRI